MAPDDDAPPGSVRRWGSQRPPPQKLPKVPPPERALLGVESPANESRLERQPAWGEDRAALEELNLDAGLAVFTKRVEEGVPGAVGHLRNVRNLHAMRTFERGDRDAARREWQALIDEDPGDARPLLTRGVCNMLVGAFRLALADLDRAAALTPDDGEVYLRRAQCYDRTGDYERGAANFRRAIQLLPRSVEALVGMSSCMRGQEDHAASARYLTRAIELAPWRADLYRERAGSYCMMNRYDEELRDLDACLARDPRDTEALHSRALYWDGRCDHERELADLGRCLEVDPRHVPSLYLRADLLAERGQHERALEDMNRTLAILGEARFPQWAQRAECHAALGDLDAAIADLGKAIAEVDDERSRRRGPTLFERAGYDLTGQRDPVAQLDARPTWSRAELLLRRGDREPALADLRRALELDRFYHDDLREPVEQPFDPERALDRLFDLERILLVTPEPRWHVQRARIFLEAGWLDAARADVERALGLDPKDPEALDLRARIDAGC